MGLAEMNFDAIASSDIERLISEGTAEGIAIEYKRDMYGTSDGDKREYLKDVSSLANTFGGHLVIGLDEVGGVPTAITSIVKNGDLELQRLESLARDALEPRILGVRMRAIPHNGGYVFLIRVPRSWNGPHRVSFKGSTRFFGRTSSGAYELSVEELRSRFNASATAIERARELR
jgi:predicted HTH transcriptional regulator